MGSRNEALIEHLEAYFNQLRAAGRHVGNSHHRADLLGITQGQYSKLTNGKLKLTVEMTARIVKATTGAGDDRKAITQKLLKHTYEQPLNKIPSQASLREMVAHHKREIERHKQLCAAAQQLLDANVDLTKVVKALQTLGLATS